MGPIIENEKVDWVLNPMHENLKNLIIICCIICTIVIIALAIIYKQLQNINWDMIFIVLAIIISIPLGSTIIFLACPIRMGFSETKTIIDWYYKPISYSINDSIMKDSFPQATKVIKRPTEIKFEDVVDFRIFNYGGGGMASGGFYYMADRSVLNTSGIGLSGNDMIMSNLYKWLKIHNPKSPLFLELEQARIK